MPDAQNVDEAPIQASPRLGRNRCALLGLVWGAFVGAAAVVWVCGEPQPRPSIRDTPWSITDSEGYAVTPQRGLELDMRYLDFDLDCSIEMAPDTDLDLVFRKVEHWGPSDVSLPIFHTRFAVLRMSTRRDGEGFLSREQALFGGDDEGPLGGVRMTAGSQASLHLECRGRIATGLVNGIEIGPFEVIDDFGNLALVARGGKALIHDFKVMPWPPQGGLALWWWGGIAGAVIGLLVGCLATSGVAVFLALAVTLLGGFLGRYFVIDHLLVAVDPVARTCLYSGLSLLPMAFLIGVMRGSFVRRLAIGGLLGAVCALLLLELAAREEEPRLAPFADKRMDLYFGPESGTAPFDAVGRMLSCKYAKHLLLPGRYDVLLMGGRRFFDLPDQGSGEKNVDIQLPVLLKQRLRLPGNKRVECAATPIDLSHSYQQFLMLSAFYKDFRPKVVVLGLTEFEGYAYLPEPARDLAVSASEPRARSGSVLMDLFETGNQAKVPSQSPEELAATLGDFLSLCKKIGSRLVLVPDQSLPKDYRAVMDEFAAESKTPVVKGFDVDQSVYAIEPLADTVLKELIR